MKPSDLNCHPFDSVFDSIESEKVAFNIAEILARTGDVFRRLSWDEYTQERLKDHRVAAFDKGHFDRVVDYFNTEQSVTFFSLAWKSKYDSLQQVSIGNDHAMQTKIPLKEM